MGPCAAVGCKNRYENRYSMKIKGITYHRFPRDPYRRRQWTLAVRRADWAPKGNSRLCSVHFEEHMFDGPSLLKKTAVPTLFEGLPPLPKELLKPKIEVLEDMSNDKNRILVVPEGLNVQATFFDNDDKNNVVIIKDEEDLETVLNYGDVDDIDGNRAIIVSDCRNTETGCWWNAGEDIYPNGETPPYIPKFGEESLKNDSVNYSKVRTVITYDPDFYLRKVKKLEGTVKKLQMKKKMLQQVSRRKRGNILKLYKRLKRMQRYALPLKCSTQPIVHFISQVVDE